MRLLERLYYRYDGQSCWSWYRCLRDSIGLDESQQGRLLAEHLQHSRRHVPMYQDIDLEGDPYECLRRVEPFDKSRFSAITPEALARGAGKRVRVDTTSGTSGQTFRFAVDRPELAARKAYELLANDLLGLHPGQWYLQIWGGHESGGVVCCLKNSLYGLLTSRHLIVVQGMDKQSLRACPQAVREHRGGVLVTYPSILHGLCQLGLSRELQGYRAILLTGEAVNYAEFERYGLGDNLRNRYGSREFGMIAIADRGTMRYCPERFVLEVDSQRGLLVTDLRKKTMPMLRYPIGDFVDSAVCLPNQSSSIERLAHLGRVEGRVFDVLQGRSGKRYVGTYWTLLLRKKVGVERFRIVQRTAQSLQLQLHYTGPVHPQRMHRVLQKHLGDEFEWEILHRTEIPELRNAKQRIVEVLGPLGPPQAQAGSPWVVQ